MNIRHIKTRLYLSFGLLSMIVLFSSTFQIIKLNDVEKNNEVMINNDFELYKQLEITNVGIIQVQQWLTDISATRGQDGLNDGFEQAENYAGAVRLSVSEMERLNPSNRENYRTLISRFEDYYKAGKVMANAYIEQGASGGNQFMGGFDEASDALQKELEPIKQDINTRLNQSLESESKTIAAINLMTVISAVVIIAMFMVSWFIVHSMFRRVKLINDAMVNVSENKSDFSAKITPGGNDEVSDIAKAFNNFVEKLNEMVAVIISISENLSESSIRVQNQTVDTSNSIAEKASDVNNLAAIVSQMSVKAKGVKSHIDSTTRQIQEVDERSKSGSEVIESSILQMQMLAREITSVTEIVSQLNQQSNSVGEVVNMIAGIAEQTNLLALNAAIEAARAGEHGRGFAVVADEVRNLSASTTQATKDIQSIIETIQHSSANAVTQVNKSSEVSDQALVKSRAAGESFQAISLSVSEISEHTSDIVNLAVEQSQSSDDINSRIIKINQDVQSLSNTIKQSVTDNGDLSQYSVLLKSVVSGLVDKESANSDRDADLL
ncbi:MAG: methyl-accepting chemotaxis protein [Gammaproteobacteria bacterium]|nr:methyl-accepting chemotaxis protein [Gammaproteobacteria bacterium]